MKQVREYWLRCRSWLRVKAAPIGRRILNALNQPIVLLVLGSIIFGSVGWLLNERKQCVANHQAAEEQIEMITSELRSRAQRIIEVLAQGEELQQLDVLRGTSAQPVFREYEGQSLEGLVSLFEMVGRRRGLDRTRFVTEKWDEIVRAVEAGNPTKFSKNNGRSGISLSDAVMKHQGMISPTDREAFSVAIEFWSVSVQVEIFLDAPSCGPSRLLKRAFFPTPRFTRKD